MMRRINSRLALLLATGAGLLVVLAVAAWFALADPPLEPYATFVEPDGGYSVVVLRQPQRQATFPGQAGDAPGVVRLYDRDGRVLEETTVEMVQLVDRVYWSDDTVRIPLIAEWTLPTEP